MQRYVQFGELLRCREIGNSDRLLLETLLETIITRRPKAAVEAGCGPYRNLARLLTVGVHALLHEGLCDGALAARDLRVLKHPVEIGHRCGR